MNEAASLVFPVLAFTPIGVMPYSRYENLLRVTKREYQLNWFTDLEIIDTDGNCVVVHSAKIVKEPLLTKLLGGMVTVEIQGLTRLTRYDVQATRDRVLEFLSLYPDMFQSAGVYDDIVNRVRKANTPADIIQAFFE